MANSKITSLKVKGTEYDIQDKVTTYELNKDTEDDTITLTKKVDGVAIDTDTVAPLIWHEF